MAFTPPPVAPDRNRPATFSSDTAAFLEWMAIVYAEWIAASPGDSAINLATDLGSPAAGKGDYLLAVLSALSGGVQRTQHAKNADLVTTPDFGIDNTGATDAAAALNSFIADNITSGGPYKGAPNVELTVTPGTYLLNSAVVINKSHMTLNCEGCVFVVSAGHAGFDFNGADYSHIKGRPKIVMRGDSAADIAIKLTYARWCTGSADVWYNDGATNGRQGTSNCAIVLQGGGHDTGDQYTIYNRFELSASYCGWAGQILNTSTTDTGSTCNANELTFTSISAGTNGLKLAGVQDNRIICMSLEFGDDVGVNQTHLLMTGSPAANPALCCNNEISVLYFETFLTTASINQAWSFDQYAIGNTIVINDESGDFTCVSPQNTWIQRSIAGQIEHSPTFSPNTGAGSGATSPDLNQLRDTTTFTSGAGRWVGTSATVTANNATGPDGVANSASTLVQTAPAGYLSQTTNATFSSAQLARNKPWTFALWLRCTTPRWVNLRMVLTGTATLVERHCYVTSTWQRFFVTGAFGSASAKSIRVDIRGGPVDDAVTTYTDLQMYGPQLTPGGGQAYQMAPGNADLRTDMVPGLATPGDLYGRSLFMTDYGRTAGPFRQVYGSAAPASGTWARGDICWNTAPSAAGVPAWTCVTAGTPGTWKAWAALAA